MRLGEQMKQILVTRSSLPDLAEYVKEIESIWQTHWLTNMGEKHKLFEAELKRYLGVENLELLVNGHMALELSLQALELYGEVITTPFTFASTTHAIIRNNLTPVFADIRRDDFTLDPKSVEKLIGERTVAIMPVHVYGNICQVEEFERLGQKYSLKVIYDAAHSFGEAYHGKNIASFGDVSCFSFHATKVFNSIEGGAACFRDASLAQSLYRLKNFGIKDEETVDGIGANAKLNEFCAAMGLCNLRHLDEEIAKRRLIVEHYRKRFSKVAGLCMCPVQEGVKQNYSYFPLLADEKAFGSTRDEICAALKEQGIFARKYFYPLTSAFDCFKGRFDTNATPIAKYVSERILTLPLFADLPLEEADRVADIVLGCAKN